MQGFSERLEVRSNGVSYTPDELQPGQWTRGERVFTREDVDLFARLTGDQNPIHVDGEYAKKTIFKERIVHGSMLLAWIGGLIADRLPGPGTIALEQKVAAKFPVLVGETISARIKIVEIAGKKVRLEISCTNKEGKLVMEGEAIVRPPSRKF